jgi:pyrroloquinoline quinone (PQQ) biosynthesis protein C
VTQLEDPDTQLAPPIQSTPRSPRRDRLAATPHPQWATEMLDRLRPAWDGVLDSPLFTSTQPGALPEEAWRRVICEFFCVVESFPKYMGLTLAKTTFGHSPKDELARSWLIGNIKVEARHAEWYLDWAAGHGISRGDIIGYRPHAAVAGLDAWLWAVAYRGTLAEAVGAINYAIEGTTGEWTRHVLPAFAERYDGDEVALKWLANHAEYDDEHPVQALEIVKNALSADGAPGYSLVERVESAIERSLELFGASFDYCCTG